MQKKSKFQIRSEAAKKRWQRDEDKESSWRVHIEAWRASGLSVRKFCQVNFISESSFRTWRRELALRDRESIKPANARATPAHPESPFVAIRLVPDQPLKKESSGVTDGLVNSLQLQMPGGATLLITEQMDLSLVAKLISALEAR
jgi:hypothetical protein